MKFVDCHESNKQMGRSVFRGSQLETLQTSKKNCPAPREGYTALDINAGKMLVKEPKVNMPVGIKMPTQNCRAGGKTVTRRSWKG